MRRYLIIPVAAAVLIMLPAACSRAPVAAPSAAVPVAAPAAPVAPGRAVTVELTAEGARLDKSSIHVPAGATVTVIFNNRDSTRHNFALYTDDSARTTIFRGELVSGPATTSYTFTAPSAPGQYYFRCDPHPRVMNGSFVCTPGGNCGSAIP